MLIPAAIVIGHTQIGFTARRYSFLFQNIAKLLRQLYSIPRHIETKMRLPTDGSRLLFYKYVRSRRSLFRMIFTIGGGSRVKAIFHKKSLQMILIVLLLLGMVLPALAGNVVEANSGRIIYVKQNATGDGTSWDNAIGDLHTALVQAQSGDQIWIAAGTYRPIGNIIGADPRTVHFQMKNGVAIYGGFPANPPVGMGMEARDPQLHQTILTGDLAGNDSSEASDRYQDNTYHVLYHPFGLDLDHTAILDGVTITGGYADGMDDQLHQAGGGIYNDRNSPVLQNVMITGNYALLGGGGIYNAAGAMEVHSSIVSNNHASIGGGIYHDHSSFGALHAQMKLEKSIIRDNIAYMGAGGGISTRSSMDVSHSIISGNKALGRGGGIDSFNTSTAESTKLTNVLIIGNEVDDMIDSGLGGGLFLYSDNPYELTNVTISGNRTSTNGGGLFLAGSGSFRNMIVWGNTENNGTANNVVVSVTGDEPVFTDSLVGGGMVNIDGGFITGTRMMDADPLFRSPVSAVLAPTSAGDYRLKSNSPAINRGMNVGFDPETAVDLDGRKRIINGWIDMGAYEYGLDFTLTPNVTEVTNHPVTIQVHVEDTESAITTMKWAVGEYNLDNFPSNATDIVGSQFLVVENGSYTVFVQNGAGYESVQTITVQNIKEDVQPVVRQLLSVLTIHSNKSFTSLIYDPDQVLVGTYNSINSNGITGNLTGVRVDQGGVANANGRFTKLQGILNGAANGKLVEVQLTANGPSLYVRLIEAPATNGQFDVQKISP